ncbi:MAG: septum formation protein Maf, partial [Hyphomicrobiaceae bacterium]|nr:septum formation protein Maf [Hyphomicrobiaceae bacterium]
MGIEPSNHKLFVVLASASPQRRQLLNEAGYEFTVVVGDIDESAFFVEGIKPREYAEKLALAKAKSVAVEFPNEFVIGADTIVDFNGQVIGKPADATQAEQITRKLFSAPHKVITAVAIVKSSDDVEIVESDTTDIYPKKLSDEQITEHIESGLWQDKSGAYAIKQCGDEFVEKIGGS